MQIEPPTPTEAFFRLVKIREMFRRIRDERIIHPTVSAETKEFVATYYGDMLEALDVAMNSVMKAHKLKIEPNLIDQALQ